MPWQSICLVTEDDAPQDSWLPGVGDQQSHEFATHNAGFHNESANAQLKSEPSRPSASGIEVQHAFPRFLLGNVAVTGDHHSKSGRFGLQVQLRQIVQNINGNVAHFENLCLWKFAGPGSLVDIAAHGGQRRDRGQLFQNLGCAHIPGVNDVL